MYGWLEDEALRMNIQEIVAPQDQAQLQELLNAMNVGEVPDSMEIQRVTKDGRTLDVWLTITAMRDGKGNIIGVATTERDVTERKKSEALLRRLAAIVIDSSDAITVQDFEGNITAWNKGAQKMYGYNEAEALTMNISVLVPQDKSSEALEMVRKLREEEETKPFTTQRLTKAGKIIDVWLTFTRLIDEGGNPFVVATTERDTSTLKNNNRENDEKS
jgi:two-component system CheB/CheR fusion protein